VVRQLVRGFYLMLLAAETLLEALHGAAINSFRKKGLLSCFGRCSFWEVFVLGGVRFGRCSFWEVFVLDLYKTTEYVEYSICFLQTLR